jgi:hypothetical protein
VIDVLVVVAAFIFRIDELFFPEDGGSRFPSECSYISIKLYDLRR